MKKPKSPKSPTGTALVGGPATITLLPRKALTPAPYNHRKLTGLDEASLAELAGSLKERGVIDPLIVRPLNGDGT